MAHGRPRQGTALAAAVAAASLTAFAATLDNTVVAVALREMQRDLGSGVTGLQGIVTAYTVALAALLLAGGALVDALGAKRVLLAGLLVFGTASAACAIAPGISTLIVARGVQGAGAALMLPGGLALLAATVPDPVRRRRCIAAWASVAGLALVAGPVVGGELVAIAGWPWVFWINLPICAVAFLLALAVPRAPVKPRARLDLAGMALTCLVLGLATGAVVLAGHGSRGLMALCLSGAVASATALVVVERRRPDPLLPASLMRDRGLRAAAIGSLATALALFLALVFLALFLQLVQDRDARDAGRLLLTLPAALVVAAALTSRWHATVVPVVVGLVGTGIALLLMGGRLSAGTTTRELALQLGLMGAGIGLTTAPLVATALAAASGREGLAAATVSMARELGGVIAVGGLGSVAVARLAGRLSSALAAGGVSPGARPALLDAALGARTADVRRMLLQDLGIAQALVVGPRLSAVATSSFVASTSLVLQLAGGLVLLAAAACGWLLRPRAA
ncbi:MAG: major facilitator transporter [Frankiales bacterium]|nr:major facilitator transporter [Frankiales bacterium]